MGSQKNRLNESNNHISRYIFRTDRYIVPFQTNFTMNGFITTALGNMLCCNGAENCDGYHAFCRYFPVYCDLTITQIIDKLNIPILYTALFLIFLVFSSNIRQLPAKKQDPVFLVTHFLLELLTKLESESKSWSKIIQIWSY